MVKKSCRHLINLKGVAEDCVHLRNDGYWNDAYCADDFMGYVCQISRMYSNCVSEYHRLKVSYIDLVQTQLKRTRWFAQMEETREAAIF